MYYITLKNTATAKRISALLDNRQNCIVMAQAEINKCGARNCRIAKGAVWGGCSVLLDFEVPPNPKDFRKVQDGWMPKKSTLRGKKMAEALERLPTITADQINDCVGYKSADPEEHIGLYSADKVQYYGIVISNKDFVPPGDCQKITDAHFNKLFDIES